MYSHTALRLGPCPRISDAVSRLSRCSVTLRVWRSHTRNMSRMKRFWNEWTRNRKLLAMVKTRKLKYFGHISRHASLESDIMLGTMPGLRRQGGQRKQWIDDLTEWSNNSIPDLVRKAQDRSAYQRFVYKVAHARNSGTAPWLFDWCFHLLLLLLQLRLPIVLLLPQPSDLYY